jgi:CheY-like chemotaxis protein
MSGVAVASHRFPAGAVHAGRHHAPPWIDAVVADSFPASDPFSRAPGIARPAPLATSVIAGRRRPQVLFVSYVEDERAMYSVGLRMAGFDITTYANPALALEAAIVGQPDIVVTRLMQPGSDVDGIQLTRLLRANSRTRSSAVLVITSRIAAVHRAAAAQAGADALVSLPCGPDQLAAEISRIVARRAVATSASRSPARAYP